ncbi:unnamed protein product, partial [Amoebophrya sp. A25]
SAEEQEKPVWTNAENLLIYLMQQVDKTENTLKADKSEKLGAQLDDLVAATDDISTKLRQDLFVEIEKAEDAYSLWHKTDCTDRDAEKSCGLVLRLESAEAEA